MAEEGKLHDDTVSDRYPGFDLSISELCHALKAKLTQTNHSRNSFPCPLIKSVVADLSTTAALLRRMINYHDSRIHCLPPEILAEVGNHLEDDESLVAATHVCHLWRTTLLSSPRLWSYLDFENEERALVFLERSKLCPLTVDVTDANNLSEVVRESMSEVATRVTTLWAKHGPFLDELLGWPMPMLEDLEVTGSKHPLQDSPMHLPSLMSLAVSGFDPLRYHAPLLTSFHLTRDPAGRFLEPIRAAESILDFLRNCPRLEVAFLSCTIQTFTDSEELVSLPLLRSFTHESPYGGYELCLLDRLSLPSTCRVVLVVDVTKHGRDPWVPDLPTPRDASHLSNIRTIKIAALPRNPDIRGGPTVFKFELRSPARGVVSFDRTSNHSQKPTDFSHTGLLDTLERIEVGSVETLCFQNCPAFKTKQLRATAEPNITQALQRFWNLKTLILAESATILPLDDPNLSSCRTVDTLVILDMFLHDVLLSRVQKFAELRKKAGFPLKVLTLVLPFAEPYPSELEQLMGCVGLVEVVTGRDASEWDIDKYLLGAAAQRDNANGT